MVSALLAAALSLGIHAAMAQTNDIKEVLLLKQAMVQTTNEQDVILLKQKIAAEEADRSNYIVIHCVLSTREWPGQPLECDIGFIGQTNVTAYKPLSSRAYEAHLFDVNGKEVPKTAYGKSHGLPLKPDKELLDGSWVYNPAYLYGDPRELDFRGPCAGSREWWFDMVKYFQIKEPGEYRLQVEVRLFTKDTNGIFQPFVLPSVETNLNISKMDLK
jgi:hypothetical protein